MQLTSIGYDTGVISGTLVVIRTDLGKQLGDWDKVGSILEEAKVQEMITSATTLGALIGGLSAGTLSDHTGRKPVITVASIVFILGAVVQAVSSQPCLADV